MHGVATLKQRIAGLARPAGPAAARFALGDPWLDAAIGGGLARGCLHELYAVDADDTASATGFALLLARLAGADGRTLLWLRGKDEARRGGTLYGPGLAALGVDPARLVVGIAPDPLALLRAASDALRCAGLAALVIECAGRIPRLDLTASRRLALAAAASGVTALIVRSQADPVPSAAETRWAIAAAPSTALMGAPGVPAFSVALLRHRGGREGLTSVLEWDDEHAAFSARAPLPRIVVPMVRDRATGS